MSSHLGDGSAVYERSPDSCETICSIGAMADDAVKWSTDHGPYVLMTLPFAVGISTAEFIESEDSCESDRPRDVTTVTCVETDEAGLGVAVTGDSASCNVLYIV